MKTTTLTCNSCDTQFEKPTKEVQRRLKNDPTNDRFYCSLSCSGKQNAAHLRGRCPFVKGGYHHKKAVEAAAVANTKYFGIAKNLAKILRSCRKRKKECGISVDYLMDVWEAQGGRCALSRIPLDFEAIDYIQQPSVDRIDSTKGYTSGNVQFVSCALNLAKSNMADDRMHELLRLICDNYSKPSTL